MEFKENRFSIFGRSAVYVSLVFAAYSVVLNILAGKVSIPSAFFLVLAGFVFFLIPKLLVKKTEGVFGFGSKNMSNKLANSYRFGYWMMFLGIGLTFS